MRCEFDLEDERRELNRQNASKPYVIRSSASFKSSSCPMKEPSEKMKQLMLQVDITIKKMEILMNGKKSNGSGNLPCSPDES